MPVIVAAGAAYLLLDGLLSRMLGAYWGGLAAIVLATIPPASLLRVAWSGRTPRQAVRDGIWCGLAVAGVYAWVFTAPFISPPSF